MFFVKYIMLHALLCFLVLVICLLNDLHETQYELYAAVRYPAFVIRRGIPLD